VPVVAHQVITRFAMRTAFRAPTATEPLTGDWLRRRLELFECWTLPSMRGQTCRDFSWTLLCDEATDPAVLERLRAADATIVPRLVPPRVEGELWPWRDIVVDPGPQADVLITTRLDSDDGLHREYLERVRRAVGPFLASGEPRLVVSFPTGYRFDAATRAAYLTRTENGPFISLLERPDRVAAVGVMEKNHRKMVTRYPTRHDDALRAYVQVLHGDNVSNRLGPADRRVRPGRFARDFPRFGEA